jgi:[ribosomal protein S5]-alanine N-acetyltransferase
MQEAVSVVLNYRFGTMKLHSAEASVKPGNEASEKLLQRNGFVPEGCFQ